MSFLRQFDDINKDMWQILSESSCKRPIVLYGMGDGAEKIIDILSRKGIKVDAIFASDSFVRKKLFRNYSIEYYTDVKSRLENFIVLVSFGTNRSEVIENIIKISRENELYAPDVPVFGQGLFDMEYFKSNFSRLEYIYNRLSDDISKKTFVCSIKYRLTGKISYLFEGETDVSESYNKIFRPFPESTYIDVGAYNGDTISEFTNYSGKDVSVYALEPDKRNFKKLSLFAETCGIKNIKLYNFAAWKNSGDISFYSRSGRNSANSSAHFGVKEQTVPAIDIDSITDYADFIKIDAEGAEKEVIAGAENIIRSSSVQPSLKIAAYHRTEDYFAIPEQVLNIRDDYDLYFRHFRYIPCWDTNFYFIKRS